MSTSDTTESQSDEEERANQQSGNPTVNTWDPVAGESVTVPGHPMNSSERVPAKDLEEMTDQELSLRYGDLEERDELPGESLPVFLDRDFRTDPIEGTCGTYSEIIELEDGCPVCGYDRGERRQQVGPVTMVSVSCNACGAFIEDLSGV